MVSDLCYCIKFSILKCFCINFDNIIEPVVIDKTNNI